MKLFSLQEDIGWYGTIVLLLAYALGSFGVVSFSSPLSQILNATGAAALVFISWKKKDYQLVVLNVVWGVVALVSLGKILLF